MIDVRDLHLSFGDRPIFDGISFQLGDKEKICLAGPNGSGKTTLLRLLSGEMKGDGGEIIRSRSVKVGYLKQHLGEDGGATVYMAALQAFSEALAYAKELDILHNVLGERTPTEAELDRMDFLQDELIRSNYYTAESETRKILAGLGFSNEEQDKPLGAMSGGWRMRVALARVLLSQPTCLFLDEPTNHLDLESIVWLENYIKDYSGSLVLISHDRQFVDKTCDRVMEIQRSSLTYYPLPYVKYEEEKKVRRDQLLREYKKQQDEIDSLERFVERFKAKASKATQAQSKQKQLDKIDRIEIPSDAATMKLRFPEAPPSGQWVFEAEDLGKRYGDHQVFEDGKFGIQAGEKAVLVGPNGAGKSTLLKLLQGLERATEGTVVTGANVQIGYFAQYEEPTPVESEMDLVSFLAVTHPRIPTQQLRSILGAMLFSNDDAFKKYGVLSGGERARVRLCRLLLRNCNVLILDEPTNHLDMDSKLLLMQAIADFTGTVLFVSHDRYFCEHVATRVILVRGGRVTDYPGDYMYYLQKLASDNQGAPEPKATGKLSKSPTPKPLDNPKTSPVKDAPQPIQVQAGATIGGTSTIPPLATSNSTSNSTPTPTSNSSASATVPLDWEAKKEAEKIKRKAEKRWTEIEMRITDLDIKVAGLDVELCRPETYADAENSVRLAREKREAEAELALLYQELEELESQGHGK